MKKLSEQFEDIICDLTLSDKEWTEKYGELLVWQVLANKVREYNKEVVGEIIDYQWDIPNDANEDWWLGYNAGQFNQIEKTQKEIRQRQEELLC